MLNVFPAVSPRHNNFAGLPRAEAASDGIKAWPEANDFIGAKEGGSFRSKTAIVVAMSRCAGGKGSTQGSGGILKN